jgi:hemoglobin-like flavoprotein
VLPTADSAIELFYRRLFEIDPSTRPLFVRTAMPQQHERLLTALGLVVENAERIDQLTPFLEDLGRRHLRYGVEDRHYDSVGAALLWTLAQGLGPAFTDEVRAAWTITYAIVSDTMRRAAAAAASPAAA